jgi:Tfp pilus assembly protein PilO
VILTMHDVSLKPAKAATGAGAATAQALGAGRQLLHEGTVQTYPYVDDEEAAAAQPKKGAPGAKKPAPPPAPPKKGGG